MKERVSPTQRALNIWAIILIAWSIYRAWAGTEFSPLIDEFIAKPIIFLVPIYYYIVHVEKKNFWQGIEAKFKNVHNDIFLGISIGGVFLLTAVFAHWFKFQSFDAVVTKITDPMFVLTYVAISFASSFSEEIVSRGFILQRLYHESKSQFKSIVIASLLFFFLHIPILFTMDSITGETLLQVMFTDFMLSIAVSILYLQKRDVFLPILIHAFYNLSIYFFLT